MRTCRRAVTVLALSLAPLAVWAAVPVVDDNSGYNNSGSSYPPAGYGTNGAYAGGGVSAPVSAQGELFNQLQSMQEQISRQQGVIEVLQNDVARMKQENLERYQDLDRLSLHRACKLLQRARKMIARVRLIILCMKKCRRFL